MYVVMLGETGAQKDQVTLLGLSWSITSIEDGQVEFRMVRWGILSNFILQDQFSAAPACSVPHPAICRHHDLQLGGLTSLA